MRTKTPKLGNVLIVDDEAAIRHTLSRILQNAGSRVGSVANGPEALQEIARRNYDLVYLDIRLPGASGLQVLKEIQQIQADLPVVLFTGHATLQSALEAMRLGATDYLLKPISPETLLSRTRVILSEQRVKQRKKEIEQKITRLQVEIGNLKNELNLLNVKEQVSSHSEPETPLPTSPHERFLKQGDLIIDLQARGVTFGDKVLDLPPTAFQYLVVLLRHSPDVVSYQTLVAEAQGYQVGRREALELNKWHIHALRNALEANPQQPQHILNVRGIGYRLEI